MRPLLRHLRFAALILSGGIQPLVAAPLLKIDKSPSQSVRLSWDATEPDWVLEGGASLLDFDTILSAPKLEGNLIALTRPLSQPTFFWRLRAQKTSGVAGGRNFLRDSQGNSGSWSNGVDTTFLHSTSALNSLMRFAGSDASLGQTIDGGLDALSFAAARNNDDLSRTIIALAEGGRSVTDLVDSLLDDQNPEVSEVTSLGYPGNGWGIAESLGDTTIDTALALRALKTAAFPPASMGLAIVNEAIAAGSSSPPHPFAVPSGATGMFLQIRNLSGNARFNFSRPDSSTSYFNGTPGGVPVHVNFGTPTPGNWAMTAVNNAGVPITYSAEVYFTTPGGFDVSRLTGAASYLGMAQNPDGGWGISPGSDSHLMITCEVMTALAGQSGGFANALSAGASWLANTKRNPDGGFSSEPGTSNVLETSLAVLAIRLSNQPITLDSALAFVKAAQLLNGSWQEDPYVTALATLALAQPPFVSPIPNQNVVTPALFTQIQLDAFVADPDHPDSAITWSVSGQSAISVSINDRVATITYPAGTALSETLTFTATDPDGLSASTTTTFSTSLTPPFDYSVARGGFVTGMRSFTTTPENFARIAFFTQSQQGVPVGVTYQTTSFSGTSPDRLNVGFQISADATATPGIHSFSVEYGLEDAAENPLVPLFDNVFNFTIQITP